MKCREYRVSLNPSKCVFATNQGKLLGHIVSKEGLTIVLEITREIISIMLPNHKKSLQSFLSRINFVRRYIPNLPTMLKPLIAMLKKSMPFSWTMEWKESFEEIKVAIASAPMLINMNIDKDFILYTLGGESSISTILTQLKK